MKLTGSSSGIAKRPVKDRTAGGAAAKAHSPRARDKVGTANAPAAPGGDQSNFQYRRVAAHLIEDIGQGLWSVGDPLPSESDLIERFGVSRHTIREAIRRLQSLGYLKRRQGARSILISREPQHIFVNSVTHVGNVLFYTQFTSSKLLTAERISLGSELRSRIRDDAPEGVWTRILILRYEHGITNPLCYSEVYVAPKYSAAVANLGGEPIIYAAIQRHFRLDYSRIDQEIEARSADANLASRLKIEEGSAILRVLTRFYAEKGDLVEIAVAHFPADRYRMQIQLERKNID